MSKNRPHEYSPLAVALRKLREYHNWSQVTAAWHLYVNHSTLAAWEVGRKAPPDYAKSLLMEKINQLMAENPASGSAIPSSTFRPIDRKP